MKKKKQKQGGDPKPAAKAKRGFSIAPEIVEAFRKSAEQGNPNSQYEIGTFYHTGKGVPKDFAEAAKWYRKAAERGNPGAQYILAKIFILAKMFYTEEGVPKDYADYADCAEAVKLYRKAAEQGDAYAQYRLGKLFELSSGELRDFGEAVKCYRKAAEQGDAYAQYRLGQMYDKGEGVAKDQNEAVKWYRKAAEHGDARAQTLIAGVPNDYAEAVKWYRRAAEQGYGDAQLLAGNADAKPAAKTRKHGLSMSQFVWMPNTLAGFAYCGKQKFFWKDFADELSCLDRLLPRVQRLQRTEQEDFWKGVIPKALSAKTLDSLAGRSATFIMEYLRIIESKEHAFHILMCKAGGEKISPTGTARMGRMRLDEKQYALHTVKCHGHFGLRNVAEVIYQAALDNDISFFKRLALALAKKKRPAELDWSRCKDKVAIFIVENWCRCSPGACLRNTAPVEKRKLMIGGQIWCSFDDTRSALPPLCVFTNKALAELLKLVFRKRRFTEGAVCKMVQRLGLQRPRHPKIKTVCIKQPIQGAVTFTPGVRKYTFSRAVKVQKVLLT